MRTLLIRLFIENWPRKLISLILAMIIWIVVSHSMTISKVIPDVPVRVSNLPANKTIEGMQLEGYLKTRMSLTLFGQRNVLNNLTSKDLEVVIDGKGKSNEWSAVINEKNLVSLNPHIDLAKIISKVIPQELMIKESKLISEKIPIVVTQPIGEAPKGYQFLDIWPYQLSITVNGPEEAVKKLKGRGLKLTFNLSDIKKAELDELQKLKPKEDSDVLSFYVPNSWKKVSLPYLSESSIEIDDPQANALRIDFSRQDLLPIGFSLPVTVFFPPKHSNTINPDTCSLATNEFISKKNGIKLINTPLYAQGVSPRFLETVKDMMELVIIANPKAEKDHLMWNVQFMYPSDLEDRYVSKVIADSSEKVQEVQPHLQEDYLRNRFRSYMNRFRLYTKENKKLSLKIELHSNSISVTPEKSSPM